jgi:hypothetical protein
MTDFLEIALQHASRGYPVFPCQKDKRPKAKLNDWENAATTDKAQILAWWAEDPNFLPAIPPGRVGAAVIDVDRHEGKEDGFTSLDNAGIRLTTLVFGTSLSGNGTHYWHKHAVGSVNGIYPGVDRKAQGGYVVVPYAMPDISQITESLPEELAGGIKSSNVERKFKSNSELNFWLREVGTGEPDDEMWQILERFKSKGNEQMSIMIARAVSHAAQGHPGGSYILDRMLEKWLDGDHYSGDPEEEFRANVRSAIEKFGEPVPDTSLEDELKRLSGDVKDTTNVRMDELIQSLETYCLTVDPNWEIRKQEPPVQAKFLLCLQLTNDIKTEEDISLWRTATKSAMLTVLTKE